MAWQGSTNLNLYVQEAITQGCAWNGLWKTQTRNDSVGEDRILRQSIGLNIDEGDINEFIQGLSEKLTK